MAKNEMQDRKYQEQITTIRECLTKLGFDCLGVPDKDVCSLAIELIATEERTAKIKKPRPNTEHLSGIQSIVDTLAWLDLASKRRTQLADTMDTLVDLLEGEQVMTLTEQKIQAKIDRENAQKRWDMIQDAEHDEKTYFQYKNELYSVYQTVQRYQNTYGDFIYNDE